MLQLSVVQSKKMDTFISSRTKVSTCDGTWVILSGNQEIYKLNIIKSNI